MSKAPVLAVYVPKLLWCSELPVWTDTCTANQAEWATDSGYSDENLSPFCLEHKWGIFRGLKIFFDVMKHLVTNSGIQKQSYAPCIL